MSQMEGEQEQVEAQVNKLILPEHIAPIWDSEDPLADMFDLYSSFFNPSHDPEYEVVDDNKIKIIAEFQIYNLIFCKNDLKLNDAQIAVVLDLMWTLLAINQDGTMYDGSMPSEGNFQAALSNKFEELKFELIERAKQGVLSKDHIPYSTLFIPLWIWKNVGRLGGLDNVEYRNKTLFYKLLQVSTLNKNLALSIFLENILSINDR